MQKNHPFSSIIPTLKAGGIGILPTDTMYGIVGSALSAKTVRQIYRLRKRNLKKPMIILIADIRDIMRFGVMLDSNTTHIVRKLWPGKVSVVMSVDKRVRRTLRYLHRGTMT